MYTTLHIILVMISKTMLYYVTYIHDIHNTYQVELMNFVEDQVEGQVESHLYL